MSHSFHEKSEWLFGQATSQKGDIFLERIPRNIYHRMIDMFFDRYYFNNGERMRIANYFVGISRDLANSFTRFIEKVVKDILEDKYPRLPTPEGFEPCPDNLLPTELDGHFSFASFDMAVSENGLQNIEFQAVSTYPISAARLNKHLLDSLPHKNAYIFADGPGTSWEDFIDVYESIISGDQTEGVVITDRLLKQQKTSFEFYATQSELGVPIDIVDAGDIFEKEGALFYRKHGKLTKINRLYNRILLAEALFEDNYPKDTRTWKFRFDKKYESLTFINHPVKLYEVSKRLLPYVHHDLNPECFELSQAAQDFRNGSLRFEDYVWKHKWGGAGHGLILSPDLDILNGLSHRTEDYIAQKKVNFRIFRTDDGQEKIVELRFMTAVHEGKMITVPMARIGYFSRTPTGVTKFKIHFGDNNKEGYGFGPVIIFDR